MSTPTTLDSAPIPYTADLPALWLEAILFGVYTSMFFQTFMISRHRSPQGLNTAIVFRNTTVILYLTAALHVSLGLYRMIVAMVYTQPPARFFYWFGPYWENTAYYALQSIMSYVSQSLLIYRCFILYNRNWWIITPSLLLLGVTMGIGTFVNYLWRIPGASLQHINLVNTILPLALVQHIGTPSLTVYRLLRQHRDSRRSGIQESRSRLSLQTVSMVILESTGIYIVVLITAIAASAANSDNKQIPINISTPTLGICFSLITIRLHNLSRLEAQDKSTVFSVDHRFVFNNTTATGTVGGFEFQNSTTDDQSEDISTLHTRKGRPLSDSSLKS